MCSTLYVYPSGDGNEEVRGPWSSSVVEWAAHPEVRIRMVYHRRCMEKILTNPRGPYDPEVVASMYQQYREQLLEQFEERKPGAPRYTSEDRDGMPAVSESNRDGPQV